MEEWRSIPSLPEYDASSEGRVRRRPFKGPLPNGGERSYGGHPSKGQWSGNRYIFVFKGRSYKVHRVVCEAFNGPPPTPRAVCMHLDENSSNNVPGNLQWGTQKENLNAPKYKAGLSVRFRKLSDAQEREVVARRANGELLTFIARDFGIAFQTVSDIFRRHRGPR